MNARVHGTTHEVPRERFDRDERAVLLPLAERPYQSLGLTPERLTRSASVMSGARPRVVVERRPLAAYTQLADDVA